MLEIRIESEPLELTPGTSVQITNSSPIFDRDSIDRKFSMPFRLPLSPKNKSIRRHANRLDAGNKSKTRPATVRFGGHLLLSGNMVQTNVSDTQEEVSIANDPLKIWERLGKIKINEILETFDLLEGLDAPIWEFGMGSTGTYQITVDGTAASASAATIPDIPTAGASIATQLNTAFPGIANYNATTNRLELDAQLVVVHPIELYVLFNLADYENNALFRQNAVRDHVVATNSTPIPSHCFPLIKWDNFYGDTNFLFQPPYGYRVFNNVIDGVLLENLDMLHPTQLQWQNSILPCVRIPYILTKIGEALGDYVWAGDVWDDVDFQKLIHVPNLALDEVTEDVYDDLETHKRNTFKPLIILNNHVPSMSAAEFITRLCTTFALYLAPADGVLEFKKKQLPLQVKPINLTNRVSKAFQIQPSTIDGWTLAMDTNTNELATNADQLKPVVSAGGEQEVTILRSFFMEDSVKISDTHFGRLPVTNQPGKSPAVESGATKSTMPLTLLFCHELQLDSEGGEYVHASHDGLNYDGDTVGAYSLSPEGEFGIYEKWWKGVIEYLVADSLKIQAFLHAGEIQKLLLWDVGRIEFYHPEGTVLAAIKNVSADVSESGVQPTQLELYYQ